MKHPKDSDIKLMGILNVTPDSFFDGNQYMSENAMLGRIDYLVKSGVDIIDLGGESSRPGSHPVSVDEEISRILPALRAIRERSDIPVSLDTRKAAVVRVALEYGINIINDISALRFDPEMIQILTENSALDVVIMHCQGDPDTMQTNPQYQDVVNDITNFFVERIAYCELHGIKRDRIILDPGIGFGKDLIHNQQIIGNLKQFKALGNRLMIGASRKRFIDAIYPSPVSRRLPGTLAAAVFALENGVDILRVHDVEEHRQFISVYQSIKGKKVLI